MHLWSLEFISFFYQLFQNCLTDNTYSIYYMYVF